MHHGGITVFRPASRLFVLTTFAALAGCDEEGRLNRLQTSGRFEPAMLDFGEVPIGRVPKLTAALRNTGEINLTVDEVVIPPEFTVDDVKGGILGRAVASNNTLDFVVGFAPDAERTVEATLTVLSDDVAIDLSLRGTGVFRPFSDLRADPASLDFGTVAVGESNRMQVVLTNTGNIDAVIDDARVNGAPVYAVTAQLPFTIATGQALAVDIEFTPNDAGRFDDVMRLSTADGDFVDVALEGSAIRPAGDIFCEPSPLDFGEVARGNRVTLTMGCRAVGGPARIVRARVVQGSEDGFSMPVPIGTIDLGTDESATLGVAFAADGLPGSRSGRLAVEYSGSSGSGVANVSLLANVVPPPPGENEITTVLRWDANNTDVDIHLVRPGGTFFTSPGDCFFNSRNPDWGVQGDTLDNPFLDVDNRQGFGPETINLRNAEPGRYQVWVHYYAGRFDRTTVASVDVFLGGVRVGTFQQTLACERRWLVGFIDWFGDTGTFSPDTFQSTFRVGGCSI